MRRILGLIFGLRALLVIVFMVASMFAIDLDRAHGAEVDPTPTPTSTSEPTADPSPSPAPSPTPTPGAESDDPKPPVVVDASSLCASTKGGVCVLHATLTDHDREYLTTVGGALIGVFGLLAMVGIAHVIGSWRK